MQLPPHLCLALIAFVLASAPINAQEFDSSSPNVILILSDDQGTVDLGACGTADVVTPNLDALAERGVRFTQFYAASSICSPSRAAILTGRYPQRCGVPGNVSPNGMGLPREEITIAESFQSAGYRTAIIGKWHLGSKSTEGPLQQGFDRFFGHRQGCIDNWSHFFYWNGPNRHDLWSNDEEHWEEGTHFGDLIVREANSFLRQQVSSEEKKPFFLYLPFNSPHYPLQGKKEWREQNSDSDHLVGPDHIDHNPRHDYLAMVSTMDEQIGQILSELDRLNLRKNTIVIFQSDHGHSTEVRAFSGGGSAGPFRGAKFSLFEGGIRVPSIISWPGKLPKGETRGQMAHATDWFPTLSELANVPLPKRKIDGRSLVDVIQNPNAKSPHSALHWQVGDQWAVRFGVEKLIQNPRDTNREKLLGKDASFLIDMKMDVAEQHNLASDRPEIVEGLTALHLSWKEDVAVSDPFFSFESVSGIHSEAGVVRRDPSDVVKVGDRYLVWYTKLNNKMPTYPEGYGGEIWFASSTDEGRSWVEEGLAIGHGPDGTFDSHGVFTPNILKYKNEWFLYYTAVADGFENGPVVEHGRTSIAVAVSNSVDGPWIRPQEPILLSSWKTPEAFDSYRVDDACLAIAKNQIRLYYKGRSASHGHSGPRNTRLGLAIAGHPQGPFVRKNEGRPIQDSGHEVLIWQQGGAFWSLVSPHGPRGRTLRMSRDGLNFDAQIFHSFPKQGLRAPGLFRPELSGDAPLPSGWPRWGIHMNSYGREIGLQRFTLRPPAAKL